MKKQDFNQRITLIVRDDLEMWQALNTASHLSAYFGNFLKDIFSTDTFFTTSDQVNFPRNMQYPIVILKASQEQLQAFAKEMHNHDDVESMFFIKEMIDTTNDERIEALVSLKDEEEIIYLGLGIFGDNKAIKQITSAFKLWS